MTDSEAVEKIAEWATQARDIAQERVRAVEATEAAFKAVESELGERRRIDLSAGKPEWPPVIAKPVMRGWVVVGPWSDDEPAPMPVLPDAVTEAAKKATPWLAAEQAKNNRIKSHMAQDAEGRER